MVKYLFLDTTIPGSVWRTLLKLGVPAALYLIIQAIRAVMSTRMLFVKGRQLNLQRAYPYDSRPPVLYLRSFKSDGIRRRSAELEPEKFGIQMPFDLELPTIEATKLNFEYGLAIEAGILGPVIAIGDPRKAQDGDFGALREYYPGDEWQAMALEKMKRSQLIIFRSSYGEGKGVLWEEEQLLTSFLTKTIFLLEVRNSALERELLKKLPGGIKGLSTLDEIAYPCYLEFPEQGTAIVSRDIARTALFNELFHLSRYNRHYMYCTNCGTANKSESHYCVKCGQDLKAQQIPVRKKTFNPFVRIVTSDAGYLLIALLFLLNYIIVFCFDQYWAAHRGQVPDQGLFNMESFITLSVAALAYLIMVGFTANARRQLVVFLIVALMIGYDIYRNLHLR